MRSAAERQKTILVLEDDPIARGVFRKVLRAKHFNVLEAATAEEALRLFRAAPWKTDLLIADCILDDGSGIDVATEVRRYRPDLPVLVTSGTPQTDLSELGERAEFLSKPFHPKLLVGMVKGLLEGPRPSSAPSQPEVAVG